MANVDYATIKANAETALNDVLTNGQHTAHGGRVYTAADLDELKELIDWAEAKEASQSRGGIRGRRVVPKR